jgi:hypothetical protein
MTVVPSSPTLKVIPSKRVAHRGLKRPSMRISYRPEPSVALTVLPPDPHGHPSLRQAS